VDNSILFFSSALQGAKRFKTFSWVKPLAKSLFLLGLFILPAAVLSGAQRIVGLFIACNLIQLMIFWAVLRPPRSPASTPVKKQPFEAWGTLTKKGFFILLVNLSFPFVIRIDQILISFSYPIERFAIYSFAHGALYFLWVFASSIPMILIPTLSSLTHKKQLQIHHWMRRISSLFFGLFLVVFFGIEFIVHWLLPKYSVSLPIIKILVGNIGILGIIRVFHFTFFKVIDRRGVLFFITVGAAVVLGIFVQGVIFLEGSLRSIAWMMFFGAICWFILSDRVLMKFMGAGTRGWFDIIRPLIYLAGFWLVPLGSDVLWEKALYYILFLSLCFWVEFRVTKSLRFAFLQAP